MRKPASSPKVIPIQPPLAQASARAARIAILNELGRLSSRLQAVKPLQDRYEQLRAQVAGWYGDAAADESFTEETDQFVVEIGARGEQRHIRSIRHLQKRMGGEFWKHATVPMSALDTVLTEAEAAEYIDKLRTGPRRVKVTAKLVEEPLQAAA